MVEINFAKSALVTLGTASLFCLCSCDRVDGNIEKSPEPRANLTNNELSASVADRAGIIGEPSFIISEPITKLIKAWNATGIIRLKDSKEDKGSIGIGTFVRNTKDGKLYVLTAKHVIYDVDHLTKKSKYGFFGYDLENKRSIRLELEKLANKLDEFKPQDDKILIPVEDLNVDSVEYSETNSNEIWMTKDEIDNLPQLFSVSLTVQNQQAYKFYQNDFGLRSHTDSNQKLPLISSDIDALPGLSGSPIFMLDKREMSKLIGILVKGSNQN